MTSQTYIIDQPIYENRQSLQPFALTDVLIEVAGIKHTQFLHFWQLKQTMILGMKDTRVPHLAAGIKTLQKDNYQPLVRNSGGLGVISDAGVLNVSLILPISVNGQKTSIDEGYEAMLTLVRSAFSSDAIEAYEITDSYCPGTYDLSIGGKKFAGIAQRRVKNGLAIMMYLSIEGDQLARGSVVQRFYQASLNEQFGLDGYPPVNPESMANLPDLLRQKLTVQQVKEQLVVAFEKLYGKAFATESPRFLEEINQQESFSRYLSNMVKRNELIKELLE
ncbi:octanoyl-[GcvH]:protein N-octanoyltransferase [Enterococcus sp. AZ194]|uniref:lipoate--protein ligase family protein n=1 Tax=Enterococcus sp. AZ194 TaxID=2774629 RepID=UPI003F25D97D